MGFFWLSLKRQVFEWSKVVGFSSIYVPEVYKYLIDAEPGLMSTILWWLIINGVLIFV